MFELSSGKDGKNLSLDRFFQIVDVKLVTIHSINIYLTTLFKPAKMKMFSSLFKLLSNYFSCKKGLNPKVTIQLTNAGNENDQNGQ